MKFSGLIAGDPTRRARDGTRTPESPVAIFWQNATVRHDTWLRLTTPEMQARLGVIFARGSDADAAISRAELETAIAAVERHHERSQRMLHRILELERKQRERKDREAAKKTEAEAIAAGDAA